MTIGTTLCRPAYSFRQLALYACGFVAAATGTMAQTGVGMGALANNVGNNCVSAFGERALSSNVTGDGNTAFGEFSLFSNVVGNHNCAHGCRALYSSTGDYNNAFASSGMYNNTTGSANNAFGYNALAVNSTGDQSSAFGHNALASNVVSYSTAFGAYAMYSNTSGFGNSAFGHHALDNNTTGNYNTAEGYGALTNNTTGDCNVAVGYLCGPTSSNLNNTISIGCNSQATADNTAVIGNVLMTTVGSAVNWSVISDGRFKDNVRENVPGIDFIKKLRPVTYNYDLTAFDKWRGFDESAVADCYATGRTAKEAILYSGFIAQEVEQAATELNYDFSGIDKPLNDQTPYALRYAEFVVPMVKAMQEQQQMIEAQQARATDQENLVQQHQITAEVQQKKIAAQQRTIESLQSELATVKQRLEQIENLLASLSKTSPDNNSVDNSSSLNVYPNPTDGMVKIEISNASRQNVRFQLADVTGKILLTRTASDAAISITLDLSGYPAGNYMLSVTQGAQTMSRVIVFGGK